MMCSVCRGMQIFEKSKAPIVGLAKKFHPDVSQVPDGEERFREVNEAYQVLSDRIRRARYDRTGSADFTSRGGRRSTRRTNETGRPNDAKQENDSGKEAGSKRESDSEKETASEPRSDSERKVGRGRLNGLVARERNGVDQWNMIQQSIMTTTLAITNMDVAQF